MSHSHTVLSVVKCNYDKKIIVCVTAEAGSIKRSSLKLLKALRLFFYLSLSYRTCFLQFNYIMVIKTKKTHVYYTFTNMKLWLIFMRYWCSKIRAKDLLTWRESHDRNDGVFLQFTQLRGAVEELSAVLDWSDIWFTWSLLQLLFLTAEQHDLIFWQSEACK